MAVRDYGMDDLESGRLIAGLAVIERYSFGGHPLLCDPGDAGRAVAEWHAEIEAKRQERLARFAYDASGD